MSSFRLLDLHRSPYRIQVAGSGFRLHRPPSPTPHRSRVIGSRFRRHWPPSPTLVSIWTWIVWTKLWQKQLLIVRGPL